MKKALLFTFSLTSLLAVSQINITSADVPAIGYQTINLRDFNLSVNVGTPGTNQIYDLSGLIQTGQDTIQYQDPSQTIYNATFPTSSMAMYNTTDSSYSYLKLNSGDLSVLGMTMPSPLGTGANALLIASDPLIQMTLPSTYLSSFSDTANLSSSSIAFYQEISQSPLTYFDSVRAQVAIGRTSLIDGWGNLNTPFGTTFPVVRQTVMDIRTITPQFNMVTEIAPGFTLPLGYQTIPGTEITDTTITYYYLANRIGDQPMILAEITQNGMGITTAIKYAKLPFLGVNEIAKNSNLFIYPNPANEFLNFNSKDIIEKIEITTIDGKIVKELKTNSNEVKVHITELIAGNYLAKIYTVNGISTNNFVKK